MGFDMSFAWTTLAALALILPGLAFFGGLHTHQRFPRHFGKRNPLGDLGLAMFVAAFIHVSVITVVAVVSDWRGPNLVMCMVADQWCDRYSSRAQVIGNWLKLVWYVLGLTIVSFLLGLGAGALVVRGRLSALSHHAWMLELTNADRNKFVFPTAYVMTKIQYDDKVVIYHGTLSDFYGKPEGEIGYIVLRHVVRAHLSLNPADGGAPGAGREQDGLAPSPLSAHFRATGSREPLTKNSQQSMLIEGAEIANVIFDVEGETTYAEEDMKKLNDALQRRKAPPAA